MGDRAPPADTPVTPPRASPTGRQRVEQPNTRIEKDGAPEELGYHRRGEMVKRELGARSIAAGAREALNGADQTR